jgi:transcription-repair coupling factor (superfamily II helicase)
MDDGTIAAIRSFDPLDQRGTEPIEAVSLLPATEAFRLPGEQVPDIRARLLPDGLLETLFDYPSGCRAVP